jgi:hypothetical protein
MKKLVKIVILICSLSTAAKASNTRHTFVLSSVVKAFCSFAKHFGPDETLTLKSSDPQAQALKDLIPSGSTPTEIEALFGLNKFSDAEFTSLVSANFDELNQLLTHRGFDIQLNKPTINEKSLGVVSILDVLIRWKRRGEESEPISYKGTNYPAFKLTRCKDARIYNLDGYPNPLIALDTDGDDTVYITIPDQPYSGFNLLNYTIGMVSGKNSPDYTYDSIVIPEVNLDELGDISYLLGMTPLTIKTEYVVTQALQQNKLAMNKDGVSAQSAVAIAMREMTSCCPEYYVPKIYTVDKSFVIAIFRKDSAIPYFTAYITPEFWGSPKDLVNPRKK